MPRNAVIVGVVVAVIALVVGTYAGLRSPWGAKHAQVLTGVAMLLDPDGDLVSFQADNGDTLGFHSNGIVWEAGNESGWSSPPCIRKALAKAKVEIGRVWFTGPEGGRFQEVVWVKCL